MATDSNTDPAKKLARLVFFITLGAAAFFCTLALVTVILR